MREEYEPLYKMAGMVYGFRKEKGRFVHTFAMGNLLTRLGYTPQDFLNHDLQEIFPDGTIADRLEEVYERAWRGEEQGMVVMQLSGIPILGSLTPVRQKGRITDVVVIWMELFLKENLSIIGMDRSFAAAFEGEFPFFSPRLNSGAMDMGKLLQREEVFLLHYAPVMILLLNGEGKILYASPAAADYLGLDWEGREIGEWLEEKDSLLSILHNIPGNKTVERRIRLRRGEKGERIFQVWLSKITPDLDYGAKRDRVLWIGRDISRQASQEEFLEKANHLAMIQEFAAGVAHELRNPITTIRGFLTLLQQESEGLSREGVSYFPMILSEIDKIEEVADHFLLFAQSSKAKKEEVPLRSILDEVIREAEQEGLIGKDEILSRFDGENPIVMGNREMMKLSFRNLLRYILEGKDEGSPLTVKGEREEGNFYSIQFIYTDVREKETVEKAGLPHYSLNEKGIGIEMMISYKVIADHMGQITIKREEEKTLLQVLLPYSRASSYEMELEEQILGRNELTNREKEVLKLVCLGYKNKEISEELMISEHTVKNHVSNILQKLELNDRSQLMVMFLHPQKGMK